MITEYHYSIILDFPNGFNQGQLNQEISNDPMPDPLYIDVNGDDVTVVFENPLSSVDKANLDSIVAAHVPFIPPNIRLDTDGSNGTQMIINSSQTDNREWQLPDTSDTFVGVITSQPLTNKILTAPSNNIIAKGLHTSTGVVNLSTSGDPQPGNSLVATSATTASWQPIMRSINYAESELESTTNSFTFQTKVALNSPSLPSGMYKLEYGYESSVTVVGLVSEIRVVLNGVVVAQQSTSTSILNYTMSSSFVNRQLSGNVSASIEFRVSGGGLLGLALIRRARLQLYRIF